MTVKKTPRLSARPPKASAAAAPWWAGDPDVELRVQIDSVFKGPEARAVRALGMDGNVTLPEAIKRAVREAIGADTALRRAVAAERVVERQADYLRSLALNFNQLTSQYGELVMSVAEVARRSIAPAGSAFAEDPAVMATLAQITKASSLLVAMLETWDNAMLRAGVAAERVEG